MAYEIPGFSFTLPANADLSAQLSRFVDVNNVGKAVLASADGRVVGVLNNKPLADEAATIVHSGIVEVVAEAAITAGVNVEVGAAGGARTWATAGVAVGIALEAATGAGSRIAVLLTPNAVAA